MALTTLNWSALNTGAENVSYTELFTGVVRFDASGNSYQVVYSSFVYCYPVYIGTPFVIYNADNTVYGTTTPSSPTVYIIKRNSSGMVQWYAMVEVVVGSNEMSNVSIDVDTDQNLYIAGTAGNVIFRGSNATTISLTKPGTVDRCGFFGKWNSSGVVQFAFVPLTPSTATPTGNLAFQGICVQGSNVYITAEPNNGQAYTAINANGTTLRSAFTATGNIFLKYTTAGVGLAAFVPFANNAILRTVEVDSSGNIYIHAITITANTTYTIRNSSNGLSETNSSLTFTTSVGLDCCLVKYNSSFTAQWVIGFVGGNTNFRSDLSVGFTLTTAGPLVCFANGTNAGSINIVRNNGTLSTLSTVSLTARGANLYSFDANGALSWSCRTAPSDSYWSIVDAMRTNMATGTIFLTVSLHLASAFTYVSPANTSTTINRIGRYGDSVILCLNSSGEYITHWSFKNISAPVKFLADFYQAGFSTAEVAPTGSSIYVGLSDGGAMGRPSLKNYLNKTLVVAFKVGAFASACRVFDFSNAINIGNDTLNSFMILEIDGSNLFRYTYKWYGGTGITGTSGTAVLGTQYLLTMNIGSTTTVFTIYSWNGSSLSTVGSFTSTYSSATNNVNPLNALRLLKFGRSFIQTDPFFTGTYQKILLFDGTPTTTNLATVFTSAPANTTSSDIHTFGAPTNFTPVSVKMFNNPSASSTQVSLTAASKHYLEITGLTIADEDKTELYNAAGTNLGAFPAAGQPPLGGQQTAMVSLSATISAPSAPTNVVASPGSTQATVSWSASASNGSAITSYRVTSNPGNYSATTSGTSATVSGLSNSTSYTFTVVATNLIGTSAASAASTAITVGTPNAPTITSASSSTSGQATISFSAPAANGTASITSYTVVSSPGNLTATGASSPLTVVGLTNGISYTFTVRATNSVGAGPASAASSSVVSVAASATTAVSESPASLTTYIAAQPATSDAQKTTLINNVRSAFKAATFGSTAEAANAKLAYINAMRTVIGSTATIPPTDFSSFTNTLLSVEANLPIKPVAVFYPTFTGQAGTADLSGVSSTNYLHIEIPAGYTVTLQNGGATYPLTFDGTNYTSGGTSVPLGTSIVLGDKTFRLVGIGSGTFDSNSGNNVVCFTTGTLITTPTGEVPVENMRTGDRVLTADHRIVSITKIEKIVVVHASTNNVPYVIERDAFGASRPYKALRVSPRHAIQIKSDLWELPREAAKENKKVYADKAVLNETVIYYHLALQDYATDTIIANGLATECLNDGKYNETYAWDRDACGYRRMLKTL